MAEIPAIPPFARGGGGIRPLPSPPPLCPQISSPAPVEERAGGPRSASQARLLSTARKLFAARGFHETSMADLANEANVSVGQIYRFYEGKEDIIAAIVRDEVDDRLLRIADIRAKFQATSFNAENLLERAILAATSVRDPGMIFDILAEGRRNASIEAIISALFAEYRSLSRDVAHRTNPVLSSAELDGAEDLIMACLLGSHRSYSKPRADREAMVSHSVRLLVRALAPRS